MRDKESAIVELIEKIAKDFNAFIDDDPVHFYSTLSPVGYTGFRWVTQIDPMWNAYLLSLAVSLAPAIEDRRRPTAERNVFSYRYQPNGDASLFNRDGWRQFQTETRLQAENHAYVVSVDIADFYSRVYHHRLENGLRRIDPGATRTKHIMEILKRLSNNTSYGLPVGGPAARIMSELVLNSVDYLLMAEPRIGAFCRYADDYRFFVNDTQTAHRTLGFISEKLLRNEGLSLQKSKTRIMTSSEYLSILDPPNPPAGSASKFLGLHIHYDPYSDTADQDYETLKGQLAQFDILGLLRSELTKGRIHTALTKRLIGAIEYMEPEPRQRAVLSLLDNIETLSPVIPQVMQATRHFLDGSEDTEFTLEVHRRVRDLIDSSPIANIDLNLAYMIRVLAGSQSMENEFLFNRLFNTAHGFESFPALTLRRDIILAMARWGVTPWLSDQKSSISSAHPWLRRAFIVASFSLGDEGQHWRRAVSNGLRPFDHIVKDWMADRSQSSSWKVPI
ncbi:RNA-directed DNA polymerase [Herbidospora sp. RD11066]